MQSILLQIHESIQQLHVVLGLVELLLEMPQLSTGGLSSVALAPNVAAPGYAHYGDSLSGLP